MTGTALERITTALETHGNRITRTGGQIMAQCPAHDDRTPSLSVRATESRARVKCFAGCDDTAVLDALGLSVRDLYDEQRGPDLARYDYTDAAGFLLRSVHRREGKRFTQSGATSSTPTLYRLPQVVAAVAAGQAVYLVEGEEDVHAVEAAGAVATTAPQGSSSFAQVDVTPLTGARVIVVPDQDDAGGKWLAAVRQHLAGVVEHLEVREPFDGKDVDDHLVGGYDLDALTVVVESSAEVRGGLVDLSTVSPERVDWLWPGRLPRGKLVVIDGDPSVGKSTLTIDLAARTTMGTAWPDGAPGGPAAGVLLLSAEDGLADTIAPRLVAAGADLSRVHALVTVTVATNQDGKAVQASPSLPRDVPYMETIVRKHSVALVVVDVLMAYLHGKVDAHRDQDVRGVLHQLAAMAERTGCCVLLLRHLNKAAGASPLYRGGGSIGIVGAARAAFLVARDPEDPERRILAVTKLNIAHEPPALAYRLVSDDELGCARVVWEDAPTDHTAAGLLAGPVDEEERTERDEVAAWLLDYLSEPSRGHEAPRQDVLRAAKGQGYTLATLNRAKVSAKVGHYSTSTVPRQTVWTHPDETSQKRHERSAPDVAAISSTPAPVQGEMTGQGETTGPDLRRCAPQSSHPSSHLTSHSAGTTDADHLDGDPTPPAPGLSVVSA